MKYAIACFALAAGMLIGSAWPWWRVGRSSGVYGNGSYYVEAERGVQLIVKRRGDDIDVYAIRKEDSK